MLTFRDLKVGQTFCLRPTREYPHPHTGQFIKTSTLMFSPTEQPRLRCRATGVIYVASAQEEGRETR